MFLLAACIASPGYLDTVAEFQRDKNNDELDLVVAMFADSPRLDFGPLGAIEGQAEVRGILEYDVALNTHLEFHDCVESGDEVSCRAVESNDWLRTAGIEEIAYDENRFVFAADGRIESISATLSKNSAAALGAAMSSFHQWATSNRPTRYAELFSVDGQFVYSRENAGKVLHLLREWQKR